MFKTSVAPAGKLASMYALAILLVGVYLSAATQGSAHALAITTGVLAATLIVTAACARSTLAPTVTSSRRVCQSRAQP
jgi:hypothetical protein